MAASADSEAGTTMALMACSRNDRVSAGLTALGASGAIPDSDNSGLRLAFAITPNTGGGATLPNNGQPRNPEAGRTCEDATAASAETAVFVAASPPLAAAPTPTTVGGVEATPSIKE